MGRFKGLKNNYIIEKEISLLEFRAAEIKIFQTFVLFCKEHNLRFYLAGGTLIGAIRHQGFVPWDDDMDITMPRPDYEKFRELTIDGKLGNYKIFSIYHTPQLHSKAFDRIVDTSYMAEVATPDSYLNAWIDIMPWDGMPSLLSEDKKHWKKVQKLKHYARLARTPISYETRIIKKIEKVLFCWPFKIIGPIYFAKKIDELGKMYSFEDCKRVGTFVAGYGPKEEMPKWYFIDNTTDLKYAYFEGEKVPIPAHYDYILEHMYGDYMTIPVKKISHVIKAYKVRER